jgi:hypothetical protein
MSNGTQMNLPNHLVARTCLWWDMDEMPALKHYFFKGRSPNPINRPVFCLNNKEIIYS